MFQGLPFLKPSSDVPPPVLMGYVSVQGPHTVFGERGAKLGDTSKAFHAKKADRDTVRHNLESDGFVILAESPLGIAVAGAPGAYEALCNARVEMKERLMHAEEGNARYVTHADLVGDRQPEAVGVGAVKSKAAKIDGVLLDRPRIYAAVFPSPIPPLVKKFHLRVPDDVATGLGAQSAHRQGHFGEGVKVAMPDSGQADHPYFTAHHYDIQPTITVVPGTNPGKDPVGHGTGESANIFAVAPQATLQAIRASNNSGDLVGAIASFLKAKELAPKIITNSWGGDGPFPPFGDPDPFDAAFALEIQQAIEQGILVVFSAGNGQFSIEPQVPGVLAAGGVFLKADLATRASNYTSGYFSPWFGGVTVPTVSGLVGLLPRAQYLMLPVPPGCMIDVDESKPALPHDPGQDGTTANDGWALFSGTSAAAPQLAGAAALLLGAKPALKPHQVIEALTKTALDITSGRCHPRFNNLAGTGPDKATGAGLVNVSAALKFAEDNF